MEVQSSDSDIQSARRTAGQPSTALVHHVTLDGRGGLLTDGDREAHGAAGLEWRHVEFDHPRCHDELRGAGCSEALVNLLIAPETRPRMLPFEGGLVVILRTVNTTPGEDPDDMVSLRLWISDTQLVTARQRPILSVQDVVKELEAGVGPTDAGTFLLHIVRRVVQRISAVLEELEDSITALEDGEQLDRHEVRAKLALIRRKAVAIRRYLAPQREAFDALSRHSGAPLNPEISFEFRQLADRIQRYVEDLDLLRERVLLLQDELMNRVAEMQNARTYVLSIVATIFLPLSFLTGIFGMNVAGLPGTVDDAAFIWLSICMAVLGVGIIVWLRFLRWF